MTRTNGPSGAPALSVVIPTFNRPHLVRRLVEQLAKQRLPDDEGFEVVVVDDGSAADPRPMLAEVAVPFPLVVERQTNAGAAAARDRGTALARGKIVVFLDDDMEVAPDLLTQHLALHRRVDRAVVLGHLRHDRAHEMPVFERFHAKMIDRDVAAFRAGRAPRGNNLFTGNVSLPRQLYLDVGGFDRTLGNSEDVELGIRLELAGAKFLFCDAAYTIHGSDHTSVEKWLHRSFRYGIEDSRIARKHPTVAHANPWRFLAMVNPMSRPFLVFAVASPRVAGRLGRVLIGIANTLDRLGLERVSVAGATLVYGIQYYSGVRSEAGKLTDAWKAYREFRSLRRRGPSTGPAHAAQQRA